MHGADAIPDKWIDPIGRGIRTATLNLGELGSYGGQLPQDVDELTDRTERIARQVLLRHGRMSISDTEPTDLAGVDAEKLRAPDGGAKLYRSLNGPKFEFDFFTVCVDYGESPTIRDNEPKPVKLTIYNTYKVQANVSLHWHVPEGWKVSPGTDGYVLVLPQSLGKAPTLEFQLLCERVTRSMNRATVELTIEGRPTAMLVPITLLNGNVAVANDS
jgi:hypothetical protein